MKNGDKDTDALLFGATRTIEMQERATTLNSSILLIGVKLAQNLPRTPSFPIKLQHLITQKIEDMLY